MVDQPTAKLFDDASPDTSAYSAKDIEVLEGLEPVRKRPGMYIGGTDERALHHLFAEVLDNSMDEAVAGHASWIEVSLDAEGYLTVVDNGRGIPVDPHPRFPEKSALEVIMTTLHAGGKFSDKAYETAVSASPWSMRCHQKSLSRWPATASSIGKPSGAAWPWAGSN